MNSIGDFVGCLTDIWYRGPCGCICQRVTTVSRKILKYYTILLGFGGGICVGGAVYGVYRSNQQSVQVPNWNLVVIGGVFGVALCSASALACCAAREDETEIKELTRQLKALRKKGVENAVRGEQEQEAHRRDLEACEEQQASINAARAGADASCTRARGRREALDEEMESS